MFVVMTLFVVYYNYDLYYYYYLKDYRRLADDDCLVVWSIFITRSHIGLNNSDTDDKRGRDKRFFRWKWSPTNSSSERSDTVSDSSLRLRFFLQLENR